jgi:hypothetical protein
MKFYLSRFSRESLRDFKHINYRNLRKLTERTDKSDEEIDKVEQNRKRKRKRDLIRIRKMIERALALSAIKLQFYFWRNGELGKARLDLQ